MPIRNPAELAAIIGHAAIPQGGLGTSPFLAMLPPEVAKQIYSSLHMLPFDAEQQRGLVYKLRLIAPEPRSDIDAKRLRASD